jgi:hypothetical protein
MVVARAAQTAWFRICVDVVAQLNHSILRATREAAENITSPRWRE